LKRPRSPSAAMSVAWFVVSPEERIPRAASAACDCAFDFRSWSAIWAVVEYLFATAFVIVSSSM